MKTFISLLCLLSFSLTTLAQSNRDKIKTLKIAYITEKLDLSAKEAQKFWPIYNIYEEEISKLRSQTHQTRKNIDFETISDDQAKQILKEKRISDTKKQALENDFIDNLSQVISAKKIILLDKIEDDFKRKMFEEYKKRGRN